MSRHRDSVLAALNEIRDRAARGANVDLVRGMQSAGLPTATLDLLADIPRTPVLSEYVAELREVLASHQVNELQEAEVMVTIQLSTRETTCVAESNVVTRRTMNVADVAVRPRIRTRWVNIWLDSERRIEWLRTRS